MRETLLLLLLGNCTGSELRIEEGRVAVGRLRALSVEVLATFEIPPPGGCGPRTVLVHVTRDGYLIGEELASEPSGPMPLKDARRVLKELKYLRPDRRQLVVQADDSVRLQEISALLDSAAGFDFLSRYLLVGPGGPFFSAAAWTRPMVRRRR